MVRIDVEPGTRAVTLHMDLVERERLVGVMADWLAWTAGIPVPPPQDADVACVLELRRILLTPEEPQHEPRDVSARKRFRNAVPHGRRRRTAADPRLAARVD